MPRTNRAGGEPTADPSAVQGFNSEEMEAGRSYQTNAGDAGVVCDVGDVQNFSFVVTACLCTCGGQQEGEPCWVVLHKLSHGGVFPSA